MKMVTLLAIVAVLGALVWAVGWGPWQDISLTRILVSKGSPGPAPVVQTPEEKTVPAKTAARRVRGANPPRGSTEAPAAPVAVVQAAPPAAPPPPKKFPTQAELPAGMRGSRIEAAFGPPVARTISVDQNGQIEVFIYRQNDPAAVTFVHLRNGQVMSASTVNY